MIMDHLYFGQKRIDFEVKYSDRKSLGITINPDTKIIVKAPAWVDMALIKAKVKKNAPWIIKQQHYFISYHPITTKRKFVNGESHLYLGRNYRLIIENSFEKINKDTVKLKGGFIRVYTKDKSNVEELLLKWFRLKAEEIILDIAIPIVQSFKNRHKLTQEIKITFRSMKKRWGSCTPKGKIILNPDLIKAPKPCIEYVVTHELCHLIQHNHNANFFELQTKEMRDWAKWKQKLEQLLA
jgi:predicted metal-dependent hydrolase